MAKPTEGKSKVKTGTVIMACRCPSQYQDAVYGAGNRVYNGMTGGYRCSVCGNVKKEG